MTAALRRLPHYNTLSQAQRRGITCVWCGLVLTAASAVDLGPQPLRILDYTTSWFPRTCRQHANGPEGEAS
ncbi:hypothetical protein [Streptomyces sp. CBMA152]|uniref:hypothetical protein n=1 Tax=Streptomyces sp. CBMA152 TaxID=1896312 RepID=UPI00166119CD|nr:hypothetical protein [Streptomyces sp. CBMA152]